MIENNDVQENLENYEIKVKPKRTLYFCDGKLEEYSDDEVDSADSCTERKEQVDVKNLSWGSWTLHILNTSSSKMLSFLDGIGEKLAWGFGITSPKYYLEIEESKKEQERAHNDLENFDGNWFDAVNTSEINVSTTQPKLNVTNKNE